MGTETKTVETTEFDDGSTIVETTTRESEFIEGDNPPASAVIIDGDNPGETIADDSAGVSDAVAIAAIEANAEVAIAEIQADISLAVIEAEQEREITWQEELAELRTNMQELTTTVQAILARQTDQADLSTPQPSMEAETVEAVEADPNNSIPLFTLEPTSETAMELTLESGGESQEAPETTKPVRKRRRLI